MAGITTLHRVDRLNQPHPQGGRIRVVQDGSTFWFDVKDLLKTLVGDMPPESEDTCSSTCSTLIGPTDTQGITSDRQLTLPSGSETTRPEEAANSLPTTSEVADASESPPCGTLPAKRNREEKGANTHPAKRVRSATPRK